MLKKGTKRQVSLLEKCTWAPLLIGTHEVQLSTEDFGDEGLVQGKK